MWKILAECYADTQLTKTLFPNCDTSHVSGHGTALKNLKETSYEKTVAFIDKSKTLASYFKECAFIKSLPFGVQFRQHSNGKKIVYLENGLERFLIDISLHHKIDLSIYKLPNDQRLLGNRIKSLKIEKDHEFKAFLNTLKQKAIPTFEEINSFIVS